MDNNTKHIVRGAEVSKKRERERDWSRFSILERERERERERDITKATLSWKLRVF